MAGRETQEPRQEVREEGSEAALEAGRRLFAGDCRFVTGAVAMDGLPDTALPEVAFAGRSNVGKSSLINALTGRTNIARTSQTPGRTREINFFELPGRLMLADLPGFGYAKAPKGVVKQWTRLIEDYLKGRPNLRRVCLLVDARRGLMKSDLAVMAALDEAAVSYLVVLTKADKLKPGPLKRVTEEVEGALSSHPAAYPRLFPTSAQKGDGIALLCSHLAMLAETAPSD